MPPPAISARKKSLQFLSTGGVRPRERRAPMATVARNHREGNLLAGPSDDIDLLDGASLDANQYWQASRDWRPRSTLAARIGVRSAVAHPLS
jgi:hypothetical protein